MNFGQGLHRKRTRMAIYGPHEILTKSFGTDSALGVYQDQYVSMIEIRAFLLACGHVITRASQLGGSCSTCLAEAREGNLLHAEPSSLACRSCFQRCSYPFCPHGLCRRHLGQLDQLVDRWYCVEHFDEMEEQIFLDEIRQQHGRVASSVVAFFKSLFFGDKRLLR